MDDHRDIDAAETADGFVEYRQGIPTADIFRCYRMDRLKSKLDPDGFDPVEPVKQFKYIAAQTVRACRNGQDFYIGITDSLHKDGFQVICRCVGVCECLEICDEGADRPFLLYFCLPLGELFGDRQGGRSGKIPGALRTAEDTAAGSDMSVAVGAGHPAV